jgi:uncharacterized glyoxalase superfamily protein PhnB
MVNFKNSIPALPVVSVKTAAEFYQAKMGFYARHLEENFAILNRGNVEIHLWQACDKSWKLRSIGLFFKPIWSGAETFIAGTASCRIEVDGIDELFEEYKANGVLHNKHQIIEEQYWGHRDFATTDLCGNLITFYQIA